MDAAELLKRIRELEEGQAELKREVSELLTTATTERRGGGAQCQQGESSSRRTTKQQQQPAVPATTSRAPRRGEFRRELASSKQQQQLPPAERHGAQWQPTSSSSRRRLPPPAVGRAGLSRRHHAMVMQSLGQAVHILDLQGKVLYWNRCAERLYGYSASEAIDREITELLVHTDDIGAAINIIGSVFTGKCWRGKFPVKNKSGERFSIITNGTPLFDDDGTMIGLICLSEDIRTLQEIIGLFGDLGILLLPNELISCILRNCRLKIN